MTAVPHSATCPKIRRGTQRAETDSLQEMLDTWPTRAAAGQR